MLETHAALPDLQIVITAGNHDAGARLDAAELLNSLNVTVVGTVSRYELGEIDLKKFLVPLKNSSGTVEAIVLAIPFLRPSDVPLLPDVRDPYLDGIRELYRLVTEAAQEMKAQLCPAGSLIAMGHCHLAGGDESLDSERRLVIGGAEALSIETFSTDIAYVALSAIFIRLSCFTTVASVTAAARFRCRLPEMNYTHQIMRLAFDGPKLMAADAVPIPRLAALMTVPAEGYGTIADVLALLEQWTMPTTVPLPQFGCEDAALIEHSETATKLGESVKKTYCRLKPRCHLISIRFLKCECWKINRIRRGGSGLNRLLRASRFVWHRLRWEYPNRKRNDLNSSNEIETIDLKAINPEEIFLSAHQEKSDTPGR